jgi:hypothetical protein
MGKCIKGFTPYYNLFIHIRCATAKIGQDSCFDKKYHNMVKTNKINKKKDTLLHFTITLGNTMSQMLSFMVKQNVLQFSQLISNIKTNISDTSSVSSTMVNSHHE